MARDGRQEKEIATKEIESYGNTTVESGAIAHLGDVIQNVQVAGGHHVHYHYEELCSHSGANHLESPTNDQIKSQEAAQQWRREIKSLIRMAQSPAAQLPPLSGPDVLTLCDALNRPLSLPYAFFRHWQTFEGFLKSEFGQPGMPGSGHVAAGNFVINKQGQENQSLGPSNWALSVHPGCKLSMAVVFSALKLSLLRCPRPSCETIPSDAVRNGSFITCTKCGLSYRLDRNVELPSNALAEQKLEARQRNDDIRRFGQRPVPTDVADIAVDEGALQDTEANHGNSTMNEYDFNIRPPSRGKHAAVEQHQSEIGPTVPSAVDWNSGRSGLEAWLNTSAMPMDEPESLEREEYELQAQQLRREMRDLQSLQRVHFVELAPETKPLVQRFPKYRKMPLESQIYLRKIVDKFPALPMNLAERFAKSSVIRKNRLSGLCALDELAGQRPTTGHYN